MPIRMTREDMLEDLEQTWIAIQALDPDSQINMAEAKDVWTRLDDHRLELTYNGARALLWQLISKQAQNSS